MDNIKPFTTPPTGGLGVRPTIGGRPPPGVGRPGPGLPGLARFHKGLREEPVELDAVLATSIKTVAGLAKASVKTVDALAIASVKTWGGLA